MSFLKRESLLNRLLKCLKSFDWCFEIRTANSASITILWHWHFYWELNALHRVFYAISFLGVLFCSRPGWVFLVKNFSVRLGVTLVPEAFFYSLLANFATRTASCIFFYWHEALRAEKRKPLVATVGNLTFMPSAFDRRFWLRTFLIALWVIWLDGLNIFGDGSGVYMFTFMGMCGELLLYQRILLPGKAKVFVVELAYNSMML